MVQAGAIASNRREFHLPANQAGDRREWGTGNAGVATGRELCMLQGYSSSVKGVALSANGSLAISASDSYVMGYPFYTLKVWEVATGRELRTLRGHSRWVNGVALSADGRLTVSASKDFTLRVWGVATGQVVSMLLTSAPLHCCAMTPDGKTIVAGDSIGGMHFLEWVGGDELQAPETAQDQEVETRSGW